MTAETSLIAVGILFATAYVIALAIRRIRFRRIEREQPIEVCAWCPDKDARTADAARWGVRVTHGICPACRDRVMDDKTGGPGTGKTTSDEERKPGIGPPDVL